MPTAREIAIIIKAVDKASAELRAASGMLKELGGEAEKASKKTVTINESLKNIGKQAALSAIGLVALGVAAKKAFEFGEAGANIQQTGESFDMLMDSLGAAPDILQQMKDAVGGTVSEMGLMSSTMTLVAGASTELAISMVDAAPRLLEIAKAANKLNPSLGSTSFLYESLARGIKRSSPLILDNTGLVIKVGEANEAYAESLGVTVEALTAADKQQALLNAALVAGDVLIQQVGGNTDSAADSFARFSTMASETGDDLKSGLSPAIAAVVDGLANVFLNSAVAVNAFQDIEKSARDGAEGWNEYINAINAAFKGTGFFIDQAGGLRGEYGELLQEQAALTESQWRWNEAIEGGSREMPTYANHMRDVSGTTEDTADAMGDLSSNAERVPDALVDVGDGLRDAAERSLEAEMAMRATDKAMRDMADAASDLAGALSNVDVSTEGMWRELSEAAIAAGATDDEILQLALDTDLVSEAEARATIASRNLTTATEANAISLWSTAVAAQHLDKWQRLTDESADLLEDGEYELAAAAEVAAEKELAIANAIIGAGGAADDATTETDELTDAYGRVPPTVETVIETPGLDRAIERSDAYLQFLGNIDGKVVTSTIRTVYDTVGSAPTGTPETFDPTQYAHGTNYVPNDGLAYLHQGEAVLPRSDAAAYRNGNGGGGGGTVVIAPVILERSDYTDANGDVMFEAIAEMVQAQQGAF